MEALPDLTGVRVVWIGCGYTIAPQEKFSERQKNNLLAIWEGILYASGAEYVTFDTGYSTNTAYEEAPLVSTVQGDNPTIELRLHEREENALIEIEEEAEPVAEAEPDPIETIILDSMRLEFQEDLPDFIDENEASAVLSSVAKSLISHPDNHVYVIGTTAGDVTDDFTQALSKVRANTVKDRLVQFGVLEEQMTAKGLGSGDPYHEYDLDENGYMIEEIARRNRKTIIMDVNSPEAMLLALDIT